MRAEADEIVLETPRLRLRRHTLADLDALCAMDTDAEARRYNGGVAARDVTERYLRRAINDFGQGEWKFAVDLKPSGPMVAWVWLKRHAELGRYEIGYQVARAHYGQGIATEAAQRLLQFAFEDASLDSVLVIVDPANAPSLRVAEKLGAVFLEERDWGSPSGRAVIYEVRRVR